MRNGDVYAAGAASMGAGVVNIKSPGSIGDEIVTVAAGVKLLDVAIGKAIAAGRSLPEDFVTGWASFKAEFGRFAAEHSSWLSRTWYAAWEKTVEYRKRLEDWREKFQQLTGQTLNYPSPGAVPESDKPAAGFPWNKVFWGLAIVGGLYAGAKFLGEARGLKHDIAGERPIFDRDRRRRLEDGR